MKSALKIIALVAVIGAPVAHAQTRWAAVDEVDALTDKPRRAACATEAGYELCVSFAEDGVWFRLDTPGALLGNQFPALRVDQLPARDGPPVALKDYERSVGRALIPREAHGSWMLWRSQVWRDQGSSNVDAPPEVIEQMVAGSSMLVRAYLADGKWQDVTYQLKGFCAEAAKVYRTGKPALQC